jgi:hypothetical protein
MFEELLQKACPQCYTINHVLICQAGDARANEREVGSCFKCNKEVFEERCCWIFTAETAVGVKAKLARTQNRLP